ncbi:uncharacterized protein PAE49_012381 [Odontesthes bonariensis]
MANETMERKMTTILNNGERLTDDRRVNDGVKDSEIRRVNEGMNKGGNENGGEKVRKNGEVNADTWKGESRSLNEENMKNDRESVKDGGFRKELTVIVELAGPDKVTLMELLRGIKESCGIVLACRLKAKSTFEITMQDGKGKARLMDGFLLKGVRVMAKEVRSNELVVSFLNLPPYITDEEICEKLATWGVKATSPIKRRKWPGTDVADGTRFCKVQFNDKVQSLPYSTKFETLEGGEYFRVIHDRQVKVCRLCIQPGHILRECPEFKCHKCAKQGHYARECNDGRGKVQQNGEQEEQNGGGGASQEIAGGEEEQNGGGAESLEIVEGEEVQSGGGAESLELVGGEEVQSGGGAESLELAGGEEEQSGGGAESLELIDGEVEQMEEGGERDGEEEDLTVVEETPTQMRGEKERDGHNGSEQGEDRGEERRAMVERRRRQTSGASRGLRRQRGGGVGGSREDLRAGQECEWAMGEVTDSSEDNMEEVIATRKRPLGKREVKRIGKVKKSLK